MEEQSKSPTWLNLYPFLANKHLSAFAVGPRASQLYSVNPAKKKQRPNLNPDSSSTMSTGFWSSDSKGLENGLEQNGLHHNRDMIVIKKNNKYCFVLDMINTNKNNIFIKNFHF